MFRSLQAKFLLLLLCVAAVALSGTFLLRELMMRDFTEYLEGDAEDRAYAVLAAFEGAYERDGGWKKQTQANDTLWAMTLGFRTRLLDEEGREVMTTEGALAAATPALRRRLDALTSQTEQGVVDKAIPYPLFLGGKRIGTLEMSVTRQVRGGLFLSRANRFLLISVLIVGGFAVLLSIPFSRRLTKPIRELAFAAFAISRGDLSRRVADGRGDEIGELTDAFNRMAGALEAQDGLRRKLIADVAHELRTPLAVMRGEIEAMVDGMIPMDQGRLQSLYDETGRLKRMVEGIEELNRAETSVLSLAPERFPLRPFLGHIVERFERVFEENGVKLEAECPEDVEVFADPERLSQIVINLLSNAGRATMRGGKVSIRVVAEPDGRKLYIEDTGQGISEEDLPFIFERFYKGAGGGLGIGLTVVKELVEAHGGSVEVESTLGKGSIFTVALPWPGVHNSS